MPVIIIQPTTEATGDDTYLEQSAPTTNRGTALTIQCGGINVANGVRRGLLRFDLNPLAGLTIQSAILTLGCSSESDPTDFVIGAHRALTEWFELGSTWNLRNTSGSVPWAGGAGGGAGSDYVALATATVLITGTGLFDLDVTADVAGFVAGTYTNYGWWINNVSEAVLSSNKFFRSAAASSTFNAEKPKLTITTAGGLLMRIQLHAAQRRRS